jgi:hypothetical protein
MINIQPTSDLFNSDGTFGWSDFLQQELINSQMHEEEVSRLLNSSGTFDFSDFSCQAAIDNIKFQAKEVETMKPTPNLLLIPPSPTTVCATISKEVRFVEEDAVMRMDIPKTARRSLRFASEVSVRTHSVMVGDHPCCMDGMAIELGWESRDGTATLRKHRKCKKEAPRLSYAQRVQRLHMVTSLTYSQLWLVEVVPRQCYIRHDTQGRTVHPSDIQNERMQKQRVGTPSIFSTAALVTPKNNILSWYSRLRMSARARCRSFSWTNGIPVDPPSPWSAPIPDAPCNSFIQIYVHSAIYIYI